MNKQRQARAFCINRTSLQVLINHSPFNTSMARKVCAVTAMPNNSFNPTSTPPLHGSAAAG
jgi:hypothetical protein